MDDKRPTHVAIGTQRFEIEYPNFIADNGSVNYGEYDHEAIKVRIASWLPVERQRETLVHELLHAVDCRYLGDVFKENQVERLANGLFDWLRANAAAVTWIIGLSEDRPSQVLVGQRIYAVLYEDELEDSDGEFLGSHNLGLLRILISTAYPGDSQRFTLVHECVHALDYHYLAHVLSEKAVTVLAAGLFDLIRANPGVVSWIIGEE